MPVLELLQEAKGLYAQINEEIFENLLPLEMMILMKESLGKGVRGRFVWGSKMRIEICSAEVKDLPTLTDVLTEEMCVAASHIQESSQLAPRVRAPDIDTSIDGITTEPLSGTQCDRADLRLGKGPVTPVTRRLDRLIAPEGRTRGRWNKTNQKFALSLLAEMEEGYSESENF
ncbi:hypothetical protein M427DRAFT_40840 [Gonapodya prolifera JEL478]|uniref:Uncharacterized protein n=1 Tax=Gonapodya prolifera (strain JEL478) TaxID=1344416 RepID=A0A139AWW0_GONPJ|nr:hypothetical protein M427DRAFT_40840 [Gonapodya prolifera JEL478]|eukprot:KXS21226.1 hypothetical protein M427DRAFT_40840 [Gonapodya prolifera JEL478]